ncbi:MAG TPA: DUF1697 domain-containing protein [Allosphingosinicella sp.]|jgi:uncharacterized protein (DUF1697 family)|uniref:DUF1697 domain-containing protein n=1 Tax=Allosphingosinicella sp. TaxID=2823234 RepID=UPI002F29EB6A
MERRIALLRAVNVGGRKMPMAELRGLCGELGWRNVQTYIQSGNILFSAEGTAAELESALEQAIDRRFGYWSDAMVRSGDEWRGLLQHNPLPEESAREPNRVFAGIAKSKIVAGAAAVIAAKAVAGERVEEADGALWFHYPAGLGTSKITPKLIDRAAGSPVTARNWRTVVTLSELLGD